MSNSEDNSSAEDCGESVEEEIEVGLSGIPEASSDDEFSGVPEDDESMQEECEGGDESSTPYEDEEIAEDEELEEEYEDEDEQEDSEKDADTDGEDDGDVEAQSGGLHDDGETATTTVASASTTPQKVKLVKPETDFSKDRFWRYFMMASLVAMLCIIVLSIYIFRIKKGPAFPNDTCDSAERLSNNWQAKNGVVAKGDELASSDLNLGFCGVDTSGPGVWYEVVGTGGELALSVCESDFLAQVSIFTGFCDQLLDCVIGVVSLPDPGGCEDPSVDLVWNTTTGKLYKVYVTGTTNQTGTFSIAASNNAFTVGEESCVAADQIKADENALIEGTTVDGLIMEHLSHCGDAMFGDITSPSRWYAVRGTGDVMRATIHDTNYRARLSVFEGTCQMLECLGGNFTYYGALFDMSMVTWNSTSGADYYILVHGDDSDTGDFSLRVEALD